MNFKDFKFKDYINQGLKDIGFYSPTLVQEKIIPMILSGQNVIGKSQTGTGKTHAFLLPMLEKIDESLHEVQAVIITPTRELAMQISNEVGKLVAHCESKIDYRIFVGGTNRDMEIKRLDRSQPQIVIGTLGKLNDLVKQENILKVHTAKMVVVDEADMVFESSEMVDVDLLFAKFSENTQMLIFSATISKDMIVFLDKYLSKNEVIDLSDNTISKSSIQHIFIPSKNKNKFALLVDLLGCFNPYLVLIFANTVEKVDEIADYLAGSGFKVGKLTGKLQSRERKQILKRIKDGLYQYVVASDIAARGIDITGVSHIINFELPNDIEFYIHRTGRTARFDATGLAITLYDYEDDKYIDDLISRNLDCTYMAIKNHQLVPTTERNRRVNPKKIDSYEQSLHTKIPLGKKVKPGYKKKRKETIDIMAKKYRKSKIAQAYRKKLAQKAGGNNENR